MADPDDKTAPDGSGPATLLLGRTQGGDEQAAQKLLPIVYNQL